MQTPSDNVDAQIIGTAMFIINGVRYKLSSRTNKDLVSRAVIPEVTEIISWSVLLM